MKHFSMAHAGTVVAVLFTLFTSLPHAAAQTPVSWVTVRDNREQAFSVEVPRDWRTFGGMFRRSLIDARPFVDMTSPDGKINVRIGDASVPTYSTPKNGFAQVRAVQMRASSYVTGEQLAVKYGESRFSHLCQGLKLTRSGTKTPKYSPVGQGAMRGTGGEAVFSCSVNGESRVAYVYSETFIYGYGQSIANWQVVALGSVLAPADQAMAAVQMLVHSGQSLTMNPAWSQMQNQIDSMVAKSNMGRALATIRETARENAYEQRVIANMDHDQANMNDIINGVSLQRDPHTEKEYEIPLGNGGPTWIDPASNVAVQSALSPGAAFTQLQTIGR